MTTLGTELPQYLERHRRAPLRTEAVRDGQKVRLEDRLQHELRRHLRHPVPHRRDPQRPLPSIGLRYVPASHQTRPVLARSQLSAELFQEVLDPALLDVADRLAVDSRCAAVAPHPLPRFPEDVIPPDLVVQRMETAPRSQLGPGPQPTLQLSHFLARPKATGVVRSGLAGHSLALTRSVGTTTPGALPSGRVVRHGHLRYYDPLG